MKRYFLFLVKSIDEISLAENYLTQTKTLVNSALCKVQTFGRHLIPVMPQEDIHLSVIPVIMASCEAIHSLVTPWSTACFQNSYSSIKAFQRELHKLSEIYEIGNIVTMHDTSCTSEIIHSLLDELPPLGSYTLDVLVDESLFTDLNPEVHIFLHGALLRMMSWYHVSPCLLRNDSCARNFINGWSNCLGVSEYYLDTGWMTVWKGQIQVGAPEMENSFSFGKFELKCEVPGETLSSVFFGKSKPFIESEDEDELLWSCNLEMVEEFNIDSLPYHLVCPVRFRMCTYLSNPESRAQLFLRQSNLSNKMGVILRLGYWEPGEMPKETRPDMSFKSWKKAVQQGSIHNSYVSTSTPSGYLHFILVSNGMGSSTDAVLYPLWRATDLDASMFCSNQLTNWEPLSDSNYVDHLKAVPFVPIDSILNALRLSEEKHFNALSQWSKKYKDQKDSQESLVELANIMSSIHKQFSQCVNINDTRPSTPPEFYQDHNLNPYDCLGDPNDWPERRYLLHKSLAAAKEASKRNAKHKPGVKTIAVSAKDILQCFDENGNPKKSPIAQINTNNCSLKPSIQLEKLNKLYWPDLKNYWYHDTYYNVDMQSEEFERSCNAAKDLFVCDETSTTCDPFLSNSVITVSDETSLPNSSNKHSKENKMPLRRSPRKHVRQPLNSFPPATRERRCAQRQDLTQRSKSGVSPRKVSPERPMPQLQREDAKTPVKNRKSNQRGNPRTPVRQSPRRAPLLQCSEPPTRQSPRRRRQSPRKQVSERQPPKQKDHQRSISADVSEKLKLKLRAAVADALEKNGIDMSDKLFRPCGKKLFAICAAFLKDVVGSGRTSALLQSIADSHAKQVIDFELAMENQSKC